MMNNFHTTTHTVRPFGYSAVTTTQPHTHINSFGAEYGKSCKLSKHVPGDCGTIWCEIHSKKAKDGRDMNSKLMYMHMYTPLQHV